MFRPDDSHLALLFEFGLGRGDGGPWKRRLGEAAETPTEMLARQLQWAIDHGFAERVDLMAGNGVDVRAPLADGRSPAQRAADAGRLDIAATLTRHGGGPAVVDDSAQLLDRLLTGGAPDTDPGGAALDACRARWPDLIHRATTPDAIRRIADAGFDVNARRDGATALHQAAWNGDPDWSGHCWTSARIPVRVTTGSAPHRWAGPSTATRTRLMCCLPPSPQTRTEPDGTGQNGRASGRRHHCQPDRQRHTGRRGQHPDHVGAEQRAVGHRIPGDTEPPVLRHGQEGRGTEDDRQQGGGDRRRPSGNRGRPVKPEPAGAQHQRAEQRTDKIADPPLVQVFVAGKASSGTAANCRYTATCTVH